MNISKDVKAIFSYLVEIRMLCGHFAYVFSIFFFF